MPTTHCCAASPCNFDFTAMRDVRNKRMLICKKENIYLRKFKTEEIFLNEEETRIVLKFIFDPSDHEPIETSPINDKIRGFAQGLLLEAIDASYAVGFVESIFRSTANPTKGAIKVIKKFGKKAAKHWFKYATVHDIQNAKVYDFIRDHIAIKFKSKMRDYLASTQLNKQAGAFIAYNAPSSGYIKVWG